jgi:toxin ParE1/3/4
MKLRFTPLAVQNITEIADYLRTENPLAAQHVRSAIYESLKILLLFPHAGRRQNIPGIRKFVTRQYRYLVYYNVDEDAQEIVILSVKHPAQTRRYTDC